jgi:hypothetical protein
VKGPNLKWLVSRAIFLARWRGRLHPSQCIRRIVQTVTAMVSPGLGSIPRTNSAANRPGNRPRPHDRSGCRPRCFGNPVPPPLFNPWSRRRKRGTRVNTVEAGLPRPSGRTEKRAGAAPANTTSLLRAAPRVRAQSGLLRRRTTPHRSPSLGLDMDADPSGLGSSPSAILVTVSPQDVTYGTGEGDVRSCGSRARTG